MKVLTVSHPNVLPLYLSAFIGGCFFMCSKKPMNERVWNGKDQRELELIEDGSRPMLLVYKKLVIGLCPLPNTGGQVVGSKKPNLMLNGPSHSMLTYWIQQLINVKTHVLLLWHQKNGLLRFKQRSSENTPKNGCDEISDGFCRKLYVWR